MTLLSKSTKIGVAAIATLVGVAGPALAAPPYTVDVGGDDSGTVYYFDAASDGSITFTVANAGGNRVMTCDSVTAEGTITTGATASTIATITDTDWIDCVGVGQNLTVNQVGNWPIDGTDTLVSSPLTDVVDGEINNVNASVTSPLCNFDVVGLATGSFDEAAQTLDVDETGFTGNLEIVDASCINNVVETGDFADFVGSFDVNTYTDAGRTIPAGPINVAP